MASAHERMTPHLTSILKVRLPRTARDATNDSVSLYLLYLETQWVVRRVSRRTL